MCRSVRREDDARKIGLDMVVWSGAPRLDGERRTPTWSKKTKGFDSCRFPMSSAAPEDGLDCSATVL